MTSFSRAGKSDLNTGHKIQELRAAIDKLKRPSYHQQYLSEIEEEYHEEVMIALDWAYIETNLRAWSNFNKISEYWREKDQETKGHQVQLIDLKKRMEGLIKQ